MDPPDTLCLNENDVHIWRADLKPDEPVQNPFLQLLSADEKLRAQKFRFTIDASNFITARGILRSLIGKYLNVNPAAISFRYSKFGKPVIVGFNSFRFNISHSQNMALFAFAKNGEIGVDVEHINPDIEVKDIAKNFFSANEIIKLLALPEEQQVHGFFNCWTRKEAFIKAVGEGLSFPLDKFEVSLEPGQPPKLLATHWDPEAVSNWAMYSLPVGPGFVGSLVIEGGVKQLKLWNWLAG